MRLDGVLLGAGMVFDIQPGDYLYGEGPVRFTLNTVIEVRHEWGCDWVVLEGMEKRPLGGPWRSRRLQVRVKSLARSQVLSATV